MSSRLKCQQALIDELHAIAKRIEQLVLLDGVFSSEDDYVAGQCNSCLIVAHQQLETIISVVRDCGSDRLEDPSESLVFQIVERRRQPRGQGRVEAKANAKAGVGRSGVARRVVAGGSAR